MRTKIIATIGPASDSEEVIYKMILAGMDVARMNFSHASEAWYLTARKRVLSAAKKAKRKVLIMQDLQGPRIRVGVLPPEGKELVTGSITVFSTMKDDPRSTFIDYPKLHQEIRVGHALYLANGDLEATVTGIKGNRITTRMVHGGTLHSRKGVNVPNTRLSNAGLTAKDIRDLKMAMAHGGTDLVAISFVQTAADVLKLRKIVGDKVKIVAKIETALAVENMDDIIKVSDSVMVARGDLSIELPFEKIPLIQKELIRRARWYGKGSITATQMLLSMVHQPRPTRSEVGDVANAVCDGTDAIMLSEESANGKYPVEAVATMRLIANEAEKSTHLQPNLFV